MENIVEFMDLILLFFLDMKKDIIAGKITEQMFQKKLCEFIQEKNLSDQIDQINNAWTYLQKTYLLIKARKYDINWKYYEIVDSCLVADVFQKVDSKCNLTEEGLSFVLDCTNYRLKQIDEENLQPNVILEVLNDVHDFGIFLQFKKVEEIWNDYSHKFNKIKSPFFYKFLIFLFQKHKEDENKSKIHNIFSNYFEISLEEMEKEWGKLKIIYEFIRSKKYPSNWMFYEELHSFYKNNTNLKRSTKCFMAKELIFKNNIKHKFQKLFKNRMSRDQNCRSQRMLLNINGQPNPEVYLNSEDKIQKLINLKDEQNKCVKITDNMHIQLKIKSPKHSKALLYVGHDEKSKKSPAKQKLKEEKLKIQIEKQRYLRGAAAKMKCSKSLNNKNECEKPLLNNVILNLDYVDKNTGLVASQNNVDESYYKSLTSHSKIEKVSSIQSIIKKPKINSITTILENKLKNNLNSTMDERNIAENTQQNIQELKDCDNVNNKYMAPDQFNSKKVAVLNQNCTQRIVQKRRKSMGTKVASKIENNKDSIGSNNSRTMENLKVIKHNSRLIDKTVTKELYIKLEKCNEQFPKNDSVKHKLQQPFMKKINGSKTRNIFVKNVKKLKENKSKTQMFKRRPFEETCFPNTISGVNFSKNTKAFKNAPLLRNYLSERENIETAQNNLNKKETCQFKTDISETEKICTAKSTMEKQGRTKESIKIIENNSNCRKGMNASKSSILKIKSFSHVIEKVNDKKDKANNKIREENAVKEDQLKTDQSNKNFLPSIIINNRVKTSKSTTTIHDANHTEKSFKINQEDKHLNRKLENIAPSNLNETYDIEDKLNSLMGGNDLVTEKIVEVEKNVTNKEGIVQPNEESFENRNTEAEKSDVVNAETLNKYHTNQINIISNIVLVSAFSENCDSEQIKNIENICSYKNVVNSCIENFEAIKNKCSSQEKMEYYRRFKKILEDETRYVYELTEIKNELKRKNNLQTQFI